MIELKEYELPHKSFMGGWYMPENLMDDVLAYYKKNEEHLRPGTVGQDSVKPEVKDSMDLILTPDNFDPPLYKYRAYLQQCLDNYMSRYPRAGMICKYDITNYNIQGYKPGGGFKTWHCERGSPVNSKRVLAFMTYLNTLENAGTEYEYQELKTESKKGLTIIWPADWTHTHKGIVSETEEKYIVTGWFSYVENYGQEPEEAKK